MKMVVMEVRGRKGCHAACYPTWLTSFIDNTDQIYFYDWLLTPDMVQVELEEIDRESLPGTLMLKPQADIEITDNNLCDFTTLDGDDPMLEECAETAASERSVGIRGVAIE